ncbi:MAG: helix-turn-helix domain-containing protein [Oscillospiraceae bacterium]|nr:helix-turn-helix domain-containing protein [Oscillospiraceae bacterium]
MNENNSLPEVLTAKDLQAYLHISRAGAYNLMNRTDFPTLHIGKRKLVTRQQLDQWIEKNTGRITL